MISQSQTVFSLAASIWYYTKPQVGQTQGDASHPPPQGGQRFVTQSNARWRQQIFMAVNYDSRHKDARKMDITAGSHGQSKKTA